MGEGLIQTATELAQQVVAREGGFGDDPDYPGGATKFGVTIHTMRRLGVDLTGDGSVTAADVRRLSRAQATAIFIEHYFNRPPLGDLPEALQAGVFDMYVDSGAPGVKILQRLLCGLGFVVAVGGALGPQSVAAAAQAMSAAPDHLVDAYGIARRNYYFRLADRRPASRKYARTIAGGKGGWIKRAEEFIDPKYHLSDAEFAQRTAAWG